MKLDRKWLEIEKRDDPRRLRNLTKMTQKHHNGTTSSSSSSSERLMNERGGRVLYWCTNVLQNTTVVERVAEAVNPQPPLNEPLKKEQCGQTTDRRTNVHDGERNGRMSLAAINFGASSFRKTCRKWLETRKRAPMKRTSKTTQMT